MKHFDDFSKRIIAIGLSLMGVMLCATLFVSTMNKANAANGLPAPYQAGNAEQPRIMMDYTSVHVPSQDKTYYEVLVWDTQTGKSKLFYYDYSDKKFKAYDDNVQLPAQPLN